MNINFIWIVILLLAIGGKGKSQSPIVELTDQISSSPIKDASIQVFGYTIDSVMVMQKFYFSDESGIAQILIKKNLVQRIEILIHHLEYKALKEEFSRPFPKDIRIQLEKQQFDLPEVSVSAPESKLQEENENYDADSLKTIQTRSLRQLIEKIPGLAYDGIVLKYKGKEVDRFLLDSQNVTGDNYQLAVEILPAGIVESIEIWKNTLEDDVGKGIEDQKISVNINTNKPSAIQAGGNGELEINPKSLLATNFNGTIVYKSHLLLTDIGRYFNGFGGNKLEEIPVLNMSAPYDFNRDQFHQMKPFYRYASNFSNRYLYNNDLRLVRGQFSIPLSKHIQFVNTLQYNRQESFFTTASEIENTLPDTTFRVQTEDSLFLRSQIFQAQTSLNAKLGKRNLNFMASYARFQEQLQQSQNNQGDLTDQLEQHFDINPHQLFRIKAEDKWRLSDHKLLHSQITYSDRSIAQEFQTTSGRIKDFFGPFTRGNSFDIRQRSLDVVSNLLLRQKKWRISPGFFYKLKDMGTDFNAIQENGPLLIGTRNSNSNQIGLRFNGKKIKPYNNHFFELDVQGSLYYSRIDFSSDLLNRILWLYNAAAVYKVTFSNAHLIGVTLDHSRKDADLFRILNTEYVTANFEKFTFPDTIFSNTESRVEISYRYGELLSLSEFKINTFYSSASHDLSTLGQITAGTNDFKYIFVPQYQYGIQTIFNRKMLHVRADYSIHASYRQLLSTQFINNRKRDYSNLQLQFSFELKYAIAGLIAKHKYQITSNTFATQDIYNENFFHEIDFKFYRNFLGEHIKAEIKGNYMLNPSSDIDFFTFDATLTYFHHNFEVELLGHNLTNENYRVFSISPFTRTSFSHSLVGRYVALRLAIYL